MLKKERTHVKVSALQTFSKVSLLPNALYEAAAALTSEKYFKGHQYALKNSQVSECNCTCNTCTQDQENSY